MADAQSTAPTGRKRISWFMIETSSRRRGWHKIRQLRSVTQPESCAVVELHALRGRALVQELIGRAGVAVEAPRRPEAGGHADPILAERVLAKLCAVCVCFALIGLALDDERASAAKDQQRCQEPTADPLEP